MKSFGLLSSLLTYLLITATCIAGDPITPQDCSIAGGGSAKDVSLRVTDLSGSPPYILYPNRQYLVILIFTPAQDAPGGKFTVSAEPTLSLSTHSIPVTIFQVSANTDDLIPPFGTTVSVTFSITNTAALFLRKGVLFFRVNDGNGNNILCQTAQFLLSNKG